MERDEIAVIVHRAVGQTEGGIELLGGGIGGVFLSLHRLELLEAERISASAPRHRPPEPDLDRRGHPDEHEPRQAVAQNLHLGRVADGVDHGTIALWLGHESPETTQIYLHADMRVKERALARTTSTGLAPSPFRPDDVLLAFLESL